MRVVPSTSYRRMPWKNGGGETIEILVSPEGSTLDTFEWRVSMAKVASSGPFSMFPEIDRTLAVLDGNGIRLSIAGRAEALVSRDTGPVAFPGDVPAEASLVDDPVMDLNVMTRRGRYGHAMTRMRITEQADVIRRGDITLMLVTGSDATVCATDVTIEARNGDTIIAPDAAEAAFLRVTPQGILNLNIIDIWRT
ncbi:HutD/Ves family protein [Microvirga arabica]|uniref:HutD/Ves family protein n=1 Tax=Microvirga arabica TaxID=1128671 RepID=UPI00193A131F|nr:HutD family protein [Microvirga arabica]MBM1171503.1 HutD family protein [Microvirga arabica]